MKSILDLCRQLPGSEPELRERAEELDEAVRLATEPETTGRQYLRCIADAKDATDATVQKGFDCHIYTIDGSKYTVTHDLEGAPADDPVVVHATASTEELARSAAALLAVEAMKGGK